MGDAVSAGMSEAAKRNTLLEALPEPPPQPSAGSPPLDGSSMHDLPFALINQIILYKFVS